MKWWAAEQGGGRRRPRRPLCAQGALPTFLRMAATSAMEPFSLPALLLAARGCAGRGCASTFLAHLSKALLLFTWPAHPGRQRRRGCE